MNKTLKYAILASAVAAIGASLYKGFEEEKTAAGQFKAEDITQLKSKPATKAKHAEVAQVVHDRQGLQKTALLADDAAVDGNVRFLKSSGNKLRSTQVMVRIKDGSALDKLRKTSIEDLKQAFSSATNGKAELIRMNGTAAVIRLKYSESNDANRDSEFEAITKKLLSIRGVVGIEEDVVMHPTMVANDPMFKDQWFLKNEVFGGANVQAAWDKSTGKMVGKKNVIAIVDSGITKHSDLDENVLPGYDFVLNALSANDGDGWDADPSDTGDGLTAAEVSAPQSLFRGCEAGNSSWHGTHVAGIAAAVGGNGRGVIGVAPGASILPVRVLGKCGGFQSDVSEGVRWAAGLAVEGVPTNSNPAKIINLSLGAIGACPSYLQSAISDAMKAGSVVVVAAGNSNADAKNFTPANCTGVIVVGAVAQNGDKTYYSNYGRVSISAPGGDGRENQTIYSTLNAGTYGVGGEWYEMYQGTSMAAPVISGGIALAMAANPKMTAGAAASLLMKTARAFPTNSQCAIRKNCGKGIVNIAEAVGAAVTFSPDILITKIQPLVPVLVANVGFDVNVTLSNMGNAPTANGQKGAIELYLSSVDGSGGIKVGDVAIADLGVIDSKGSKVVKVSNMKIGNALNGKELIEGSYGFYGKFAGQDWESSTENNSSKVLVMDYVLPRMKVETKSYMKKVPTDIRFEASFSDSRVGRIAMSKDWVYEWNFTSGSVVKAVQGLTTLNVKKEGDGVATLKLKHLPSGFETTATANYTTVKPEPTSVDFREQTSNNFLRAPLTVRFMPTVKTGHPLDRMQSMSWDFDNGNVTSNKLNATVVLNAGTHTIKATAKTKMGYSTSFEKVLVVHDNMPPTCTIDYSSPIDRPVVLFKANCNDVDGKIKGINWFVNGRARATPAHDPYEYVYPRDGNETLNMVIRVTDDSGAIGEAQVTVAH